MAWTVSEVEVFISTLEQGLATGTATLVFPDKSSVTYDTAAGIRDRIAYFRNLLGQITDAAAGTTSRPRRLILCPTSGVC